MTQRQESDDTTPVNTSRPAAARPAPPSPAAFAKKVSPARNVNASSGSAADFQQARSFGQVSEDGHVSVRYENQLILVGHYPDATAEEALDYFVRKYLDLAAHLALLEQRVAAGTHLRDLKQGLAAAQEQLDEKKMVGDIAGLQQRLDRLCDAAEQAEAEHKEAAAQRAEDQLAAKEKLVAEAEKIADTEVRKIQWRQSTQRMTELFDEWKQLQRRGPRLSKGVEDGLWKRFRSARTRYDKLRRAHFSQLDAERAEAKRRKEKLITQAEALSDSTQWAQTAKAYRDLMQQWKAAGRAAPAADEALWQRFRAAQDVFFNARQQAHDEIEKEFEANRDVKEALLSEAQALLPVKDVERTKAQLRDIQQRWEDAGKVPRRDINRLEQGLRAVEDAVAAAEEELWRKTDPEIAARTSDAMAQLQQSLAQLQEDYDAAIQRGDEKAAAEAKSALEARTSWLKALEDNAS